MVGRQAAGPDGYRRRTAGTWQQRIRAMVKGVHAAELTPDGKRPVTERRGPARQARFQGRRIRRSVAGPSRLVWLIAVCRCGVVCARVRLAGELDRRLVVDGERSGRVGWLRRTTVLDERGAVRGRDAVCHVNGDDGRSGQPGEVGRCSQPAS
jgi:hypothetical protein